MNCLQQEEDARTANHLLVTAIKKAKDDAWKKLCNMVESDPWGTPYKLVMKKLARAAPIPEINKPGRIQKIVQGLFPTHPGRVRTTQILDNSFAPIDTEELMHATRALKSNISPGPDCIPNEAIKLIVRRKPQLLIGIYNKCLAEGHFPRVWKKSRLVLLRKGEKPLDDPSSYRPLCLPDCAGKLLEKIIDNRLRNFLDTSHGLDDRQFGFRRGRSTTDAVSCLI